MGERGRTFGARYKEHIKAIRSNRILYMLNACYIQDTDVEICVQLRRTTTLIKLKYEHDIYNFTNDRQQSHILSSIHP